MEALSKGDSAPSARDESDAAGPAASAETGAMLPPSDRDVAIPPAISPANSRKRDARAAELDVAEEEAECPICLEKWDVNKPRAILPCCCKHICVGCHNKLGVAPCPFCRSPRPESNDDKLAILRKNAQNENPVAIRALGYGYGRGIMGLVKDDTTSALYYRRAADLGDVLAMNNLGYAYNYGEGVKLDKKKAFKYYQMAADRGDAIAQCSLGSYFFLGDGVAQNYAEALRLYKLAADQGYTKAELNMGNMYGSGLGVARDLTEAIRLYARAAAKGNKKGKARLLRASLKL